MKKNIMLFVLPILLCGCGTSGETGTEPKSTRKQPKIYAEEYSISDYCNESEFLASDFVGQMRSEGYTPYLISCNKERFELDRIRSDATFYEYRLKDKVTGNGVTCTVAYHLEYLKHPSDAFANADLTDEDIVTTVEKEGASYDVYISKKPFVDYEAYNIVYLPFEGYKVSIYADASTPEEALAYIHEFDLVPVTEEGTPAETTETAAAEETAAPTETPVTELAPETEPPAVETTIPETNETTEAAQPADSE